MLWGERRGHLWRCSTATAPPCRTIVILTRAGPSLEQDNTIIAVIEMSQSKWLVAALVPGVERQHLKKLDADEEGLLKLLHRWRNEAGYAGREISETFFSLPGRSGTIKDSLRPL
jgi:hypothetical protein